jgi:hypothetical protein
MANENNVIEFEHAGCRCFVQVNSMSGRWNWGAIHNSNAADRKYGARCTTQAAAEKRARAAAEKLAALQK